MFRYQNTKQTVGQSLEVEAALSESYQKQQKTRNVF